MVGVVVCPEPLAAEAGAEMLKKGGNVVDAVVAGSVVQGVTNPLLCGIAGSGTINLFLAKEGKNIVIGSNVGLPSKVKPDIYDYYYDDDGTLKVEYDENEWGYKSIYTPEYLRVIYDTHQRYGRLDWKTCLQPGIKLAREGFSVYPYLEVSLNKYINKLSMFKSTAEIYTKNGKPYRVGDILVQKDYSNTLEKVAEHGADIFYKGKIADIIAEDFEKHHALVTKEDLENVKTIGYEPYTTLYRGYKISTNRIPGRGLMLLEMINILEGYNLKNLGWNTPIYLDILVRTMNISLADWFRYSRDSNFFPEAEENAARVLSKEYAAEMRTAIESGRDKEFPSSFEILYGDKPTNFVEEPPGYSSSHGTTNICALDDEGNAISMIHSIVYSSGVVTPGLGFLYCSHMNHTWRYQIVEGRMDLRPGKKRLGAIGPVLVFKNGKVFMVIGSPGGHFAVCCFMQAMINVIDFGMGMQQAISVHRIEGVSFKKEVIVRPGFPYPYPHKDIKELGHKIIVDDYGARVSGILVNPETGEVEAGTDLRGGGGLAVID